MAANKLSESTQHSMVVRVVTSIVFAVITVPCAILGGWFLLALSFLLVGLGTYEVLSLPGRKRYNPLIWAVTYIAVYALVYWQFLKSGEIRDALFSGNCFWLDSYSVSVLTIVLYLGVLFLCSFCWKNFRLTDIFYLFTMVVLVSIGFYSVLFVRLFPISTGAYEPIWNGFTPNLSSCLFLWWVLFGVWTSDIGAYFTGVFFGKHPMNARISPHKTWEGFWGGTAFSLVFTAIYVTVVSYAFHTPLLAGVIDVEKDAADWGWVVLLGVLMPLLDNLGGFLFSAVKRQYNAKDWGFVLPGHGGILDRFDSVLVTSIACSALVYLIANNWQILI